MKMSVPMFRATILFGAYELMGEQIMTFDAKAHEWAANSPTIAFRRGRLCLASLVLK